MTDLLNVRGLAKAHTDRPVLRGVDLDLAPGEVLGLVGQNGAGKSTLISILAGLYPADAGELWLNGEPYAPASEAQAREAGVGIISQGFRLDPDLTVAQAIFRHSFQADRPHAELRRPAKFALADAGVDLDPDALVGSLVRPEQGLVEAVRLLVDDAQVVLVDEVAATFNVKEIEDLHFITSRLTRQGRSVVYISHRLHEVQAVADRIAVLRDGAIAAVLPAAEVGVDDIAHAMFGTDLATPRRRVPIGTDVVLRVRSLNSDTLRDVSFNLFRGEILGLVGERRSALPDVVGALTGDRPVPSGEIEVFGQARVIAGPEDAAALRIGYYSDDDAELGVSATQSIARSLMTGGWDPGQGFAAEVEAMREIVETLAWLEVTARRLLSDSPTLSGGDQQKIALARFIAEDADLMILNEPTRGLDLGSRREVLTMITDLTAAGKSAIVVCSDPADLLEWTDRIVVIDDGRVASSVNTTDIDRAWLARSVHAATAPTRALRASSAPGAAA